MFPLILGAQVVHVAPANAPPSMDPEEEHEDVSLLVPSLIPSPKDKEPEKARLQFFSKEENRKVRCLRCLPNLEQLEVNRQGKPEVVRAYSQHFVCHHAISEANVTAAQL
jgi:hypothetical protein